MDLTIYKTRIEELHPKLLFNDSNSVFTYTKDMIVSHLGSIGEYLDEFFKITEDSIIRDESSNISQKKRTYSYLLGVLFLVLGGIGIFTQKGIFSSPAVPIFYLVALSVSGGLAIFFFLSSRKTLPINRELGYLRDLTEAGWTISTQQDKELYKKWSSAYPFFKQGDADDRITVRIYGEYEGYNFCYFEYAYTIERKVEKIETDSDGNETRTTTIERDYYNKSGVFVDSQISSNFKMNKKSKFNINLGFKKDVKFSHIAFEKKFGLYADEKDISLQKLFSAKNRNALMDQTNLFTATYEHIQDDSILASFSNEAGFFKEGFVPIEKFTQLEIVPYLKERLDESVSLVKILKGELA